MHMILSTEKNLKETKPDSGRQLLWSCLCVEASRSDVIEAENRAEVPGDIERLGRRKKGLTQQRHSSQPSSGLPTIPGQIQVGQTPG